MNDYLPFMTLAIEAGKKSTCEDERSHPKVGAVIVRDGKVLETAYRGELGNGDHAEYTLFEKKLNGSDVAGTALFTTLEPCTARNTKKPCSHWVVEKGIRQVFVGMLDPNPRIYNKGCAYLKANGVEVHYFPEKLREEIERDNFSFIKQFSANPRPNGKADFDYTNNDGIFTIGNGDYIFETKWSKASDFSIHVYNDMPSVKTVAIALGAESFSEIKDATIYDGSSRARTIKEGEIVVMRNANGYCAAVKVIDVKDSSRSDAHDQIIFEYSILTDKTVDFSRVQAETEI